MATRLWIGGLEAGVAERDLEDEVSTSCSKFDPAGAHVCNLCSAAAVLQIWEIEKRVGCA